MAEAAEGCWWWWWGGAQRWLLRLSTAACPFLISQYEQSHTLLSPDAARRFKCAPPLREGENRRRLLQGLADGVIDSVGTDHSPSGVGRVWLMHTARLFAGFGCGYYCIPQDLCACAHAPSLPQLLSPPSPSFCLPCTLPCRALAEAAGGRRLHAGLGRHRRPAVRAACHLAALAGGGPQSHTLCAGELLARRAGCCWGVRKGGTPQQARNVVLLHRPKLAICPARIPGLRPPT